MVKKAKAKKGGQHKPAKKAEQKATSGNPDAKAKRVAVAVAATSDPSEARPSKAKGQRQRVGKGKGKGEGKTGVQGSTAQATAAKPRRKGAPVKGGKPTDGPVAKGAKGARPAKGAKKAGARQGVAKVTQNAKGAKKLGTITERPRRRLSSPQPVDSAAKPGNHANNRLRCAVRAGCVPACVQQQQQRVLLRPRGVPCGTPCAQHTLDAYVGVNSPRVCSCV